MRVKASCEDQRELAYCDEHLNNRSVLKAGVLYDNNFTRERLAARVHPTPRYTPRRLPGMFKKYYHHHR